MMNNLKKILFIVVIFYCFALLGLYLFQERILFQSVKLKPQHQFNFSNPFSEINLKTDDGAQLNGLYFEVKNPKGVILYFHGNRDNLVRWGTIASELIQYNYNVLVVDYRGYGKSTGKRNEAKLYQDAQQWYNYLKKTYNETKIIVYGRSLGATFATYVASKNKPQQLILEAPFNTVAAVPRYWFKYVPYNLLLKYKFNSQAYMKNVSCKTTIFHGTRDKVIPFKLGQELFNTAPNNNTRFVKIKDGKHNNLGTFKEYKNKLNEIL